MKIVINKCHGGFSPSMKAYHEYYKLKGKEVYFYKQTKYKHSGGEEEYTKIDIYDNIDDAFFACTNKDLGKTTNKIPNDNYIYLSSSENELRTDKDFIEVVEELGDEANTNVSSLAVVEIPDDIEWEIDEYDGMESVEEKHRSWG